MRRMTAAILALILLLGCLPALADGGFSAHTPLGRASDAQINNIARAIEAIDGIIVYSGEQFSFNEVVGPRTADYGYRAAINGRGAKVTGGGVAQVASTIHLALKGMGDQIEFDDFYTYGDRYAGSYVRSSRDAVLVDYSSGIDYCFTNCGASFRIALWIDGDELWCSLSYVDVKPSFDSFFGGSGSFMTYGSTPISGDSIWLDGTAATYNNVMLAAGSINDTVLNPGDLFSFNESVGPRSERYGYERALNGRGVEVVGGGVAQVASVIWLAVKQLDCVAVVEKATYGNRYSQSYVLNSNDAILTDYSSGTDFSFRNIGDEPLTISTYVLEDVLYCDIFMG